MKGCEIARLSAKRLSVCFLIDAWDEALPSIHDLRFTMTSYTCLFYECAYSPTGNEEKIWLACETIQPWGISIVMGVPWGLGCMSVI